MSAPRGSKRPLAAERVERHSRCLARFRHAGARHSAGAEIIAFAGRGAFPPAPKTWLRVMTSLRRRGRLVRLIHTPTEAPSSRRPLRRRSYRCNLGRPSRLSSRENHSMMSARRVYGTPGLADAVWRATATRCRAETPTWPQEPCCERRCSNDNAGCNIAIPHIAIARAGDVVAGRRRSADFRGDQSALRKKMISPSLTTYSLPSSRWRCLAFASLMEPAA